MPLYKILWSHLYYPNAFAGKGIIQELFRNYSVLVRFLSHHCLQIQLLYFCLLENISHRESSRLKENEKLNDVLRSITLNITLEREKNQCVT